MAVRRASGRVADENPLIGDRRQLVVLVAFKDRSFKEKNPLALWDRVFNEVGFSESDFKGSVRDYFYDQSYGQFRLTFDTYHVTLADNCSKYHSNEDDDENSKYLVADVVDSLLKRHLDWSPYDWDGDGYVDQLLILYAGKGMNDGGGDNSIWPHQYRMSWHGTELPEVPAGARTLKVDSYCCIQEITRSGSYGVFGTICHEYSHCFGLPDFYNGSILYVGTWDLMDYGNNNGSGYCPPGYSAHERMLMGWLTPVELKEPADINQMAALSDEPIAYLIRNDGYSQEYYIVENRQKSGWDSQLPGSGIVVFHVDYDEKEWLFGVPNSNNRKRYTIFPANNKTSRTSANGWSYPYLGNDSLTNHSLPAATLLNANTDGKKLMSKPLTAMSVANGLASFTFMNPTLAAIHEHSVLPGNGKVLYNFGPFSIIRRPDGTVGKCLMKRP